MRLLLTITLFLFLVSASSQNMWSFSGVYNVSIDDSLIIVGTINSKTYPVKNVMISIGRTSVVTDSAGKFRLATLSTDPKIRIHSKQYQDLTIQNLKFEKGDQFQLAITLQPQLPGDRKAKKRDNKNYIINSSPGPCWVLNPAWVRSMNRDNNSCHHAHTPPQWINQCGCDH